MSLWDNIHKKRQRIKQGSGEKMRKKGDKGAPTPDQLKRAKGEEMNEDRKKMAKLAGLYSKAMKQMPGSPNQKKFKADIDKLRKELGMDESVNEYGGPPISRKDYLKQKPMNPKLDESRMKELHGYIDRGMTAQQIAKKMKLDVKTIKALMPKTGGVKIGKPLKGVAGKTQKVGGKLSHPPRKPNRLKPDPMFAKNEETIDEAVKTTHVVIDTADGNKIVATASSEQGAKSSVASAERPPMNIKNKRTLKIVKLKKPVGDKQSDRMVGYPLKEAVSPAQQAAIAISKKERGEKPKNEAKKGRPFPYQVNIRGEGGVTVKAKDMDDAVKKAFKELGIATRFMRDKSFMRKVKVFTKYTETNESRAYRDAMRGMSARGATRGMARTKKDRDIEATDDDRKAASKNIIMQLRKAADLPTGADVEFDRGKGKVTRDQAKATLARFNALSKPNEKEKFQKSIKSLADIKKLLGR